MITLGLAIIFTAVFVGGGRFSGFAGLCLAILVWSIYLGGI